MRWPARGHSARPTGISWTTSPTSPANIWSATTGGEMVRPAGVEPATLGLEVRCSIQLSYGRPNLVCRLLLEKKKKKRSIAGSHSNHETHQDLRSHSPRGSIRT